MNLFTLQIKHQTATRRWKSQSDAFWRRRDAIEQMGQTWEAYRKAKFWQRHVSFKKRIYLRVTEAALYKMVAYNQIAA